MDQTIRARGTPIEFLCTLITLAAAGFSGALLFAIAEAGYSSFQQLAEDVKIPGIVILILVYFIAKLRNWRWLSGGLWTGFWVGSVSTIGLEAVRIIGFRVFHSMPGDLPTLMGVLMTGRIMQGPDTVSTFLGYADHFWNGAVFGVVYVLLFGKRKWWVGTIYGLILGTGFLLSPVVNAIGAGLFGTLVGPKFAVTVYLAHIVFGSLIGWLVQRSSRSGRSIFGHFSASPRDRHPSST
ncbi:hypothetical protein LLE49_17870 [Alicyclobacillus tolerans]|uniref:hypothetical protein n=1 Tax=Alicyclobacillus tolerans TaxID=90970 RepID=UPI001F4807C8|nr:hypothetical protein [Alicyclobacillus tolerans]MCF8566595.1 hypothetical protein [Alicyclobacillus tolerans]